MMAFNSLYAPPKTEDSSELTPGSLLQKYMDSIDPPKTADSSGLTPGSLLQKYMDSIDPNAPDWQRWIDRNWQLNVPGYKYKDSPPAKQRQFYEDVATGRRKLSPEEFNLLLSNEKGLITPTEFAALPKDIQDQARQDPQLFLQSAMSNMVNSQTDDLLSLGAEGGYGTFANTTWDPQTGLKFNPGDYKQVHDGFDPGLAIMGLLGAGFGALAFPSLFGAAGAGTAGTVADSNFALADAAQLAGQGLTQSQIASVMAGNSIPGTGGMFAGTGGVFGSSGNAIADAALNGAVRGGITSGLRGGDPLSGALMGGIGGGWSNYVGNLGNPILNSVANAVPGAIMSGSMTPFVTGAVGGGLTQVGSSLGLDPSITKTLASTGAGLTGQSLQPTRPIQPTRPTQPTIPKQAYYNAETGTVELR